MKELKDILTKKPSKITIDGACTRFIETKKKDFTIAYFLIGGAIYTSGGYDMVELAEVISKVGSPVEIDMALNSDGYPEAIDD